MVDVASFEQANGGRIHEPPARTTDTKPSPLASIVFNADELMTACEGLRAGAIYAPPQGVDWIRAWSSEVNGDLVIVTLQERGATVFALPLEVVDSGPIRIARYAGGSHANGNFGAGLPSFLESAEASDMRALMDALHRARPDIDLVCMDRQLESHRGYKNPVLLLGRSPSPDIALAVDLDGGFDTILARASGKRKRKKNRSQIRKFEAAGGYRIIEASSPEETNRLLTAYFDMKARQFRQMGVSDAFAQKGVQAFFRTLSSESVTKTGPAFVLDGLEVGGILRAVTGSSMEQNRIVCDFAAFSDDDLAQTSPGEFLFFHNIKSACDAGYELFDFSVGDERYKRLWCPVETQQFDTLVPLTLKGQVFAAGRRLRNKVRLAAKRSAGVRSLVKGLRAKLGGGQVINP